MKPLILVKHSVPEIVENIAGHEQMLSVPGRTRARGLAELLPKHRTEVIVSSVEPKAREAVITLESAEQTVVRFREAVDPVVNFYAGKSIIIIVLHGTVMSIFVAGCEPYPVWAGLGLPSFVLLDLQSQNMPETANLP